MTHLGMPPEPLKLIDVLADPAELVRARDRALAQAETNQLMLNLAEAQRECLRDLLRELYDHEQHGYGRWTSNMRRRVKLWLK